MSLVADIRPKPLTATLHYLKRGPEKPVRYVFDPPPGVPQWNGIDDPRDIRIEDARGREREFTIDRNGFQLVHSASKVPGDTSGSVGVGRPDGTGPSTLTPTRSSPNWATATVARVRAISAPGSRGATR